MIRTAVVRALLALVPLLLSGWLALTQTLASTCAAARRSGAAGSAGLCQGRRGLDRTAQLTALALLIGIVAGTASTVSVAAPLAIKLHAHRPSALTPTRRRAPKRAVSGAVV